MKRVAIILMSLAMMACLPAKAAMSLSEVRGNARFLSDKMAYELNLNSAQYADVYEINYDFLAGVRFVMDGVLRDNPSSVDRYYDCLDQRNEDLSYVLTRQQYLEFTGKEYFYRPIFADGGVWNLRIYSVYTDAARFFLSLPANFYTYAGLHSRAHYRSGFYVNRYHHDRYHGELCHIRTHHHFADFHRHDFRRPSRYEPVHRPGRYDRPPMAPPSRPVHRPDVRPNRPSRPDAGFRPDNNRRPGPTVRPDRHDRPGRSEVGKRPERPGSSRPSVSRPQERRESGHSSSRYDSRERSGGSRR